MSKGDDSRDDVAGDRTPRTDLSGGDPVSDDPTPSESRTSERTGDQAPGGVYSRADWERLASDPDPVTDLGYRVDDWERFETSDGSDQVIYLPSDEDLIEDDAFIVVEKGVPCTLGKHY